MVREMSRLLILGLDCATPQLVFGEWKESLPNLKALMDKGVYAPLRSTVPPITVPAWTAMMTSQDPGQLGLYGFRNRKSHGYEDLYTANANYVKAKTIWNHLSRNRMKSLIFGVPQTYPPRPLNGIMVSSFLTPGKDLQFTYPDEIKAELDAAAGGDYIIDVKDFRTEAKDELLANIVKMTEARFKAFRHFYSKDSYDFAIMVEMGIDRIHHAFWRFFDKSHRLYEPGNKYESVVFDYYKLVDREIGRTVDGLKDTSVMVVSDHGAKTMIGAICINEWFQREGYLALKEKPAGRTRLKADMIDWSRTTAWGEGGYYSRVFLNVEGREPQGQIPRGEYESFRNQLISKLEAIEDENGRCIGTKAYKPEEIYREVRNIPPDLVVHLGNLDWRSAGSVGVGAIHLFENDTGPDDANHAQEGIFIWDRPREATGVQDVASIYDIAPTVLKFLNVDVPAEMIGRPLIK
jgi:predicted AlkP superfamily phosphohydrolase/phosphomutase